MTRNTSDRIKWNGGNKLERVHMATLVRYRYSLILLVINCCHRMLFFAIVNTSIKLSNLCYGMFNEESLKFTLSTDDYKFLLGDEGLRFECRAG